MAIFAELAGNKCIFQRHPCAKKRNYWTAASDMPIEAVCSCCTHLLPASRGKNYFVTVDVNPEKAELTTLIQGHCYLHQTWWARQ